MEACESISWIEYANWLCMSQIEKGAVIESMVISYTILAGDSFGLSRAYCVDGWGCLNMFYLAYDYELTPYELMCKYYVYTYTLMWYMQYLSFVIYVTLCTDFVFGLEIIHWACGCSTPPFIYLFPQVWTLLVACSLVF